MKHILFSLMPGISLLLLVVHTNAQVYDTSADMADYSDGYAYASGFTSELTAAEQNQPVAQPTEPFTPAQSTTAVAPLNKPAEQPSASTASESTEQQEGEKKPKKVTFNPEVEVYEIEAVGKQRPVGRRFS